MTDYNLFATSRDAEGQLDSGINASALIIVFDDVNDANEFPTTKNGSATSGGDATTLNSTGIQAAGVVVGDFIFNITDGSHAFVISVSTNSITTTTLKGGTGNTWDNSDEWAVNMFVITLNVTDASGTITKFEDVLIKKRITDTLTVDTNGRAFNGTTAQSFDTGNNISLFVDFKLQENMRLAFAEMATDISTLGDINNIDKWKQPAQAATTAPLTLASDFENGDTIDGFVLTTGDRVLIKNQASAIENGIYTVNATGAPIRAVDFDEDDEVTGAIVKIKNGTANEGKVFTVTSIDPQVGVDDIDFIDFLAAAQNNLVTHKFTADEVFGMVSGLAGATNIQIIIDDTDVSAGEMKYSIDGAIAITVSGITTRILEASSSVEVIATGTPTTTISTSFAAPAANITGLANDVTNLFSCDEGNNIYIHTGFTSSITTSFTAPDFFPNGLAYDGTNLISTGFSDDKIYIHIGITADISSSFASPGIQPSGLTMNGSDLVSCDSISDLIYLHTGITSTVASSFASPSSVPFGLANDGNNLISCDDNTNLIYLHTGFTVTVSSSFASPSTEPSGLTHNGAKLISCDKFSDTIYIHDSDFAGTGFASVNYI